MKRVPVSLGTRSYEVLIAPHLLDQAAELLTPFARDGRLILVSDKNVWDAQGKRMVARAAPLVIQHILIEPGEGAKSWSGLAKLVGQLLALGLERSDCVIAFGGGVVGDLTGFACAIAKRGCRFIQIPTSLLAQVDSSVGGKTGINVAAGKNMVGAFHQPSLVIIDPELLESLDKRQLRAGYAEIVKYALIEDEPLFDWLEEQLAPLLDGELDAVAYAISASVAGKAGIVTSDETELNGRRALLNLGHTFGHAFEAETGYGEQLLHGEAVALGCALAFLFSAELGRCSAEEADRVRRHLKRAGLPVRLHEAGVEASGERLVAHMALDKKKSGGRVPFILSRGIGRAYVDNEIELPDVAAFLDRQR